MKKIIVFLLCVVIVLSNGETICGETKEKNLSLYAKAAVMIDGDTKRVLYGKNENDCYAMASTTKIMTLILALEYGDMDSLVTVSSYASKMPDTQLNICEGEQYYLKDLLYSLILESHNDSAVAIAEHISKDVDSFVKMMNDKALEIGLSDTYFLTPNGLDMENEIGWHHTTAYDLALIMRYCIYDSPKKDEFVNICQTREYTFKDYSGNRLFVLRNKNKLLDMIDSVIAGKTGFTCKAGYCYVCAIKNGEDIYIIVLLGCGWPNNKNYKWKDTKLLYKYACDNYDKKNLVNSQYELPGLRVLNGIEKEEISLRGDIGFDAVICEDDIIETKLELPDSLEAPIYKDDVVGLLKLYINNECVYLTNIYANETVKRNNLMYNIKRMFEGLLL